MSRILLVDDEPLVTATLQTLILDEMPDVEVYSVNSAPRALELLEKNVYDVVVTDVSMPRVSGLELLDRIREQGPACYVIVLTAYNSFDYAYRASRYEDVRFILKIEPPEVIMDAIRTGLDRVKRYYSADEDGERVRRFMKETMPLLKQALFEKLIVFGEALPEGKILRNCGIGIDPGRDTWLAATGNAGDQGKQEEACFLVLSMLRGRGFHADAWYSGGSLVFFIQSSGDEDVPGMILGQLDRIIEGMDPEAGLSFALSSSPAPWEKIGEETLALVRYARNELESSRIVRVDLRDRNAPTPGLSGALRWIRLIERRDLSGLMNAVGAYLGRAGFPAGRADAAQLMEMGLRETFGEGCLEGLTADGCTAQTVLRNGHYDSVRAWLGAVERLLGELFSGGGARRATETEELLDRVNRYVREHYREAISLTGIAEKFNYNSSYLSRIYKQNMREGLSEHIVRTRIEAACRLLRDSAMSVSEIADQCGFQTTKYFITVFKRTRGVTPKSWRESNKV